MSYASHMKFERDAFEKKCKELQAEIDLLRRTVVCGEGGKGEAVYQAQTISGDWLEIDQNLYDRYVEEGADKTGSIYLRILYTTPRAQQPVEQILDDESCGALEAFNKSVHADMSNRDDLWAVWLDAWMAKPERAQCKLCHSTGHDTPCAYPTEINRQQAVTIQRLTSELERARADVDTAGANWTPEMVAAVREDAKRLHAKLRPATMLTDYGSVAAGASNERADADTANIYERFDTWMKGPHARVQTMLDAFAAGASNERADAQKDAALTDVIIETTRNWFPDRAYQAEFFARAILSANKEPQ